MKDEENPSSQEEITFKELNSISKAVESAKDRIRNKNFLTM